jgi:hypothetical protein
MHYRTEVTRLALLEAMLPSMRVVKITLGNDSHVSPLDDLAAALAKIVDDGGEPGPVYTIEFKDAPLVSIEGIGATDWLPVATPSSLAAPFSATLAEIGTPADAGLPDGLDALPSIRVACIDLNGSIYVVPAEDLAIAFPEITDDGDEGGTVYTITFKTMSRAAFEALGEFDGF